VAARVGFSEASTFHRALKGWTGLTPGAYRQAHNEPADGNPLHGVNLQTDTTEVEPEWVSPYSIAKP
jgi:AraC-like DNA-binding protein